MFLSTGDSLSSLIPCQCKLKREHDSWYQAHHSEDETRYTHMYANMPLYTFPAPTAIYHNSFPELSFVLHETKVLHLGV